MVGFGTVNWLHGNYTLCAIVLVSGVCLVCGWYLLGKLKNGNFVYRLNMICYCGLILYMFMVGGEGGAMILWGFTVPPIVFFLFGRYEGLFWSGLVLVGSLSFYLDPFGWDRIYPYHNQVMLRYVVSFVVVAVSLYWFDYLRHHYQAGMEDKARELETKQKLLIGQIAERLKVEKENEKLINELKKALDNVERLEGFLPICASCRKIRDDQGYWSQLEAYFGEHSDLKFSHSICPECTKSLYPSVKLPDN